MSSPQPHQEGYSKLADGRWKITANHEIHGVTPEMIDWWWDHIDTTERYKQWHPTDHVSFTWVVPPEKQGHIGAIQRIQEFFNGTPPGEPSTLEIRWEDSKQANAHYAHVLLATGTQEKGLNATLMHEYEAMPGGTRMRSHFWFPAQAPEPMIAALYEHNKQEMAYFSTFLPWLHQAEIELPAGNAYFALGNQRITCEQVSDSSGTLHLRYWLWSNWDEQTRNIYAGDILTLVQSQNIGLSSWEWHSAKEGQK